MIEEVIGKLLRLKGYVVDDYLYLLIVAVVIAYISVGSDKSRGLAKIELVASKFPQALLLVVGIGVVCIPLAVVFALFDYLGDLLENAGLSYLEYPIVLVILICLMVGVPIVFLEVRKYLRKKRLLKDSSIDEKQGQYKEVE